MWLPGFKYDLDLRYRPIIKKMNQYLGQLTEDADTVTLTHPHDFESHNDKSKHFRPCQTQKGH